MTSTWLATPIPATTAGTPLTASQDSLPLLLDQHSLIDLEEYFVSDEEPTVVIDRSSLVSRLALHDDAAVCHLHSGYHTTIVCFVDGRISIGSAKPAVIYATPASCEHGIREGAKRRVYARAAVCSKTEVVVETASDGLWSFPIDDEDAQAEVSYRGDNVIYARQLCAERCISLRAGSDFFVALVESSKLRREALSEKEEDGGEDENGQSPCKICTESRRLRLSTLMREADRDAEVHAASVRLRKSRSSTSTERRAALLWNGIEHAESEESAARAPSMLALSEEVTVAAATEEPCERADNFSLRAVRGESPSRGAPRLPLHIESPRDKSQQQQDWLGRSSEERTAAGSSQIPMRVSVLTWGANGSGQLGHGDNVQRSQPQPIALFDGSSGARRVCGIAAGHAHVAALTAAGTAYVWGANVWSDDRSTVLAPTLFKTGESSSVLDIAAAAERLAVLVVDKEGGSSILVARTGGVSRMAGGARALAAALRLRLLEDGRLLLRTRPAESGAPYLAPWREAIGLCRLLTNLEELGKHCLQERIKQNSTASLDGESTGKQKGKKADCASQLGSVAEASRLIRRLNKALARFVAIAAVHADCVRAALREPHIAAARAFDVLNAPRARVVFAKFVDAYVIARAYGALEELPFSSESAVRFVDKISLIYDVTSTRSDSVVRKLFSLPLDFLRRSVDEFDRTTADSTDSSPSGYSTEWRLQLTEAAAALATAAFTAGWWRRDGGGSQLARSLHTPRRLLVWAGGSGAGAGNEAGLLSVTARSAGLLSARYTHVLAFNDLIVFATRSSDQRFPAQLVWLSEKKEKEREREETAGDRRTLRVDTPDEQFELEFARKEDRDTFKRRICFWHWSNFAVDSKTSRPCSSPSSSSSSLVVGSPPPTRRAARFVFARREAGEAYEGEWRAGVPHGSGLRTTSTCTYAGSFVNGLPHGFGILTTPEDAKATVSSTSFYVSEAREKHAEEARRSTVIRGNFERGRARGLCRIDSSSGCVYRGYVDDGAPHGFGERLSAEEHYIGFFSRGKKFGYGVSSELNELGTIRRKYLGHFEEGSMQGSGVLIDGCGAYVEGDFRADVLRSGRLQCPPPDDVGRGGGVCSSSFASHTLEYRGEFASWRHAMGKGTLEVSPTLRITGRFNYVLLGDEGTIKRADEADIMEARIETRPAEDRLKQVFHGEGPRIEEYSEAEEAWSWRPLVDLFLKEELGVEEEEAGGVSRNGRTAVAAKRADESTHDIEMDSILEGEGGGGDYDERTREAWRRVQQAIERRRKREEGGEEIDLSHVASAAALYPWSAGYYSMVRAAWTEAIQEPAHPLSRLAHTWVQIYQASYGGTLGAHRCVHEKAASELRLILYSVYGVVRVLFPNLPLNPLDPIPSEGEQAAEAATKNPPEAAATGGSQETLCTLDYLSLVDTITEEEEAPLSVLSETASVASPSSSALLSSLLPPPPALSFIYSHFFASLHPILLPLYIVATAEFDDTYWSKIVYLNAHTDVKLLSFLDVPRCIWPIELENPEDLGAAVICNTARYRFYESAIKMLQNIPTKPNPLDKLRILAETFMEMNSCVEAHAEVKKPLWEADTLMPAFIYVVVRAGIKHLGAEIRLIEDFSSQMHDGPIGPMFTYLKSAFVYICMQSDVA